MSYKETRGNPGPCCPFFPGKARPQPILTVLNPFDFLVVVISFPLFERYSRKIKYEGYPEDPLDVPIRVSFMLLF
jgi:hypothetical protein